MKTIKALWRSCAAVYRGVADGLLLTVLVVFLASFALYGIHYFIRRLSPPAALNTEMLQVVHPHLNRIEIRDMLNETYFDRPFMYSPYVGFTERTRTGNHVSVSPEMFRWGTNRSAKLSDDSVQKLCLFGGSTMFGYGVDDRNIIGAYLQGLLDKNRSNMRLVVFNLGHGYFFSQQEAALFQKMIADGIHCEIALFFDGVNEKQSAPHFTSEEKILFDAMNYDVFRLFLISFLRTTLMSDISKRIVPIAAESGLSPDQSVARYVNLRKIVRQLAKSNGTQAIFVIQPLPGFRNGFLNNAFTGNFCAKGADCEKLLITRMKAMAGLADGIDTHDLTGLFWTWNRTPFLDDVHYTPHANREIAVALEKIIRKSLSP